ncbi:eCIS core domain-containing protein [Streptomyces sp. bgisy126]|uniref:eCIS core domain-containing protein n=1 Tax=unclassified Streptomyces TaxID=2593676 RepID=UPI003EB73169
MRAHENAREPAAGTDRAPARADRAGVDRTSSGRTGSDPTHASAAGDARARELLALQRSAGNAAVVLMLRRTGHPWAREEHRHGAGCGHREAEGPAAVQRSAVHDVLRGPGRPLDDATRTDMEARLDGDFSDVRIHDDGAARASAAEIGARAYTSGSHVVIGDGGGDAHTLAHELTHVVQQRRGPVAGTDDGGGLRISDPSDRYEREAEANATRVMSRAAPERTAPRDHDHRRTRPSGPSPAVQRVMSPEEFKQETAVPGKMRGRSTVTEVDRGLEEYGAAGRDLGRQLAALTRLVDLCRAYMEGKRTSPRYDGVKRLHDEAATERKLLESVPTRLPRPEADGADRDEEISRVFRELLAHADKLMGPDGGNVTFADHMNRLNIPGEAQATARALSDDGFTALMRAFVGELEEIRDDPGLPDVTRRVLEEILPLVEVVSFVRPRSRPGMTADAPHRSGAGPDRRYTFNVDTQARGGTSFLLGHMAHELTHVAAHQAYDATDLMLLAPYASTPEAVGEIARNRKTTLGSLAGALEKEKALFNPIQYSLLAEKVAYGGQLGKVEAYANAFHKAGMLSAEDREMAIGWDRAAGDASGTLVEYDTVLNQMLIYLHLWETPVTGEFYTLLREAADRAATERATARAARLDAQAGAGASQQ